MQDPSVFIFFIFFGIALGAVITFALSRYVPNLPYTVTVFLVGAALSIISSNFGTEHNIFWASLDVWDNIEPKLIIYIFLPALLFGEVTNLNFFHVRGCFFQAALLAIPGAIISALVLGLCINTGFLPYDVNWTNTVGYLTGSILCATDPVAVLALLEKTTGASARLKYVVSGESLLNDGSALVLYNIYMQTIAKNKPSMTFMEVVHTHY
jgi:sodium/hydrogen exchanger 10/11